MYLNDEIKILCLLQFFPEAAQNSLKIQSFPCSEKSLFQVCGQPVILHYYYYYYYFSLLVKPAKFLESLQVIPGYTRYPRVLLGTVKARVFTGRIMFLPTNQQRQGTEAAERQMHILYTCSIFISAKWTEWMAEILFSFHQTSWKWLKLQTSNLTCMFPGTVQTWPP